MIVTGAMTRLSSAARLIYAALGFLPVLAEGLRVVALMLPIRFPGSDPIDVRAVDTDVG
jgi:hypothetical protein